MVLSKNNKKKKKQESQNHKWQMTNPMSIICWNSDKEQAVYKTVRSGNMQKYTMIHVFGLRQACYVEEIYVYNVY